MQIPEKTFMQMKDFEKIHIKLHTPDYLRSSSGTQE